MIRVSVSLANASVTETETLTAGRVGLECAFTFSSEWDDLAKVAVFEGAETIEVALGTASVAVVPPECMATAGYNLRVGVYGLSASTAIVIPTIWAKAGKIKDSAAPDDESLAPATPELVAQIIEKSDTALMLAQSVAEQAESGAFIGEPGVSPTISSSVIENGHRLTITDVNGETEVDVMNGTDGSGGVSPSVTITEITGGHRVTITDADHPTGQSFDVMDGEDGSTITVDDALSSTSENPVQNKVVKAAVDSKYTKPSGGIPDSDIASSATWNAKGTYSKPSGGIPKSDLASAVQTSLGKADTALQSFTETDPTVPSWAKQPTKPSYTAQEVGAVPAETGKGLSTNDFTDADKAKLAGIEAGADKTPDLSGYATNTELNGKVDKVSGKGLSTNDYTTAEKTKLAGIEAGADKTPDLSHYVTDSDYDPDSKTSAQTQPVGVDSNGKLWTAPGGQGGTTDYDQLSNRPSINGHTLTGNQTAAQLGLATPSDIPTVPTKTSDLTNDSGFVNASGAAAAAPVQSVNNKTGAVVLTAADVGAGTYSKPSGGIPKTDLASAVQTSLGLADSALQSYTETDPTVPSWAKASSKPSYTKSEVGLGNVDNVQQYSASNPPPYPVSSVNGQTGAVSLSIPSTPADIGAAPAVTEVTISTAGAVTQALDAGKIYHFTGALTSLTITLNAAGSGIISQYHFDFDCGSTAPTVTIPNTVTMPSGTFDASKHYEVDILNNYGVVQSWATS